ncbi:unnamed protein product [Adineta ricciae]|uniref:Uncharacterized protein n=1 Tax=Adineta ricciae TaxID=249248 RepID=A0A815JVX9_ADIRI|nr:unnamed protein product [Adineta ricciae]CAF1437231.1 unnamed protein product [Adineta ricciae]
MIFISVINRQYASGSTNSSCTRTKPNNFYRDGSIVWMDNGYQIPNSMIEHLLTISIFIIFYMALHHLWSNIIPIASNEDYINMLTIEIEEENCNQFKSGFWLSHSCQYDHFYESYESSLVFNSQTMEVNGNGIDDIGEFIISGVYSINTNRIAFIKTYREEIGNSTGNFEHNNITVQVAWNSVQYQFEGKWFRKTRYYSKNGRIELKFKKGFRAMA